MKVEKLLNVQEFAAAVGWKPSTVRQKVWRREVEFVRMGRSIRFKPGTSGSGGSVLETLGFESEYPNGL